MSHLHLLRSRGAFLYTYKSGLQQGKLLLVKSHRNILIVFRMLHKMGQGGGVFVHAAFSQNIVLRIDCHHKNLCGWPGMFHTSFTYPEGLDWIEAEFFGGRNYFRQHCVILRIYLFFQQKQSLNQVAQIIIVNESEWRRDFVAKEMSFCTTWHLWHSLCCGGLAPDSNKSF